MCTYRETLDCVTLRRQWDRGKEALFFWPPEVFVVALFEGKTVPTEQVMYQKKDKVKAQESKGLEKSAAAGIERIPTPVKNFCRTVRKRPQIDG